MFYSLWYNVDEERPENHPKTLHDHCLAILCKTRPVAFSSKLTFPLQLIPDVLERLLVDRDEGGLPFTIVNQLVEHLSDKGILSVHVLELLLRQSRGSLDTLHLSSTQLTFDDFLRLPPLAYLVDFDCTNVDHVTDALWEKLTPSRTSLRSFAAIGLKNPSFHFERIAEFSNISSLNLSNTCVSVVDVIMICQTFAESLTTLNVSECFQLNLMALLPGIRLARNLNHLALHDLPVAEDVTDSDKESVLSTFKDAFNCLSSLKFLDVGWIKDAGTVTGWDVACTLLECRGSGLTHVDVSGLASLRETLRFVKDLGIERSLQYLGALNMNLQYRPYNADDDDDDDDYADVDYDDDDSASLSSDLAAQVNDLKKVATGHRRGDDFFAFQPHYMLPTPRNHAILKLLVGRLLVVPIGDYWAPTKEEADVVSSFALRRCRADRRWKSETSYSYHLVGKLACFSVEACSHGHRHRESVLALLNEIIVRIVSAPPSSVFAERALREATFVPFFCVVDLEQLHLLLVIAFCHCSNADSHLIETFLDSMLDILFDLNDRGSLRDVAISRGFAQAIVDVLHSSLASSQSRLLSEEIVSFLRRWRSAMKDAEISTFLARRIEPFSDVLCSLYDTLDENNVREAGCLLDTFYMLSIQKSNRSLFDKPSVLSFVWRSLNCSKYHIRRVAAELFASITFELSTPFFGTTTTFDDGLSAEKIWQRIAKNCEKVPQPGTYRSESYIYTKHSGYYTRIGFLRVEDDFCWMYTLEMVLSRLENDLSTLPSPVFVYALSTLVTSYVIAGRGTGSEKYKSRIAKILRSLENSAREKNEFIGKLIDAMKPHVRGWKV